MRRLILLVVLLWGIGTGLSARQTVEFQPVTEYNSVFTDVYARHPKVPRGLLEAVSFQNTHLRHLTPGDLKPSCSGLPPVYGLMGMMPNGKNWFRNNLTQISELSGMSPGLILSSAENNVEAYARAFENLYDKMPVKPAKIEEYIDLVLALSELPNRNVNDGFVLDTYSYGVLTFLLTPEYQKAYAFPQYNIDLEAFFGSQNLPVLSAGFIELSENVEKIKGKNLVYNPYLRRKNNFKDDTPYPMTSDFAGAIWDPTTCNFSSRNGRSITHMTIHTMQGSYAGSISWFKNCDANVSAHYNVRAFDGQITQMVREIDKAWHVGNSNPYAIGIENEGFVDDPTWYTTALYNANAAICIDVAGRRGWDLKRAYAGPATAGLNPISDCWIIKGHQHYASQSHTDPGIHWDWRRFYELLNPTLPVTAYTTNTGTFTDPGGAGNYADRERRRYRISPTGAQTVTLTFTEFNLENTFDFLRVYDGTDYRANLIGTYTGATFPPVLTGTSGNLYIEFDSDCATNLSGWSATWAGSAVPPSCAPPRNLSQTSAGHSAANLTWNAVAGAVNYEIRFRRHFTNTWTTRTVNGTSFVLTGLAANGHYYWQVRANCGGNNFSAFASSSFVTPNRTNATINSCTGTFTDAGGSEGKYANNENWITTISPTGASSVTMTFTSFATANSSDNLKIYNGPNITSPLIGTYHTNTSPGTVTGTSGHLTLQFVSNASTVGNGWAATWTCQNGGGCGVPTGPATTAVGQSSATLNWAAVANATGYEIRYKRVADVNWTNANTAGISFNVSGLLPTTAYEWQVRANCSGVLSVYMASTNFTTLGTCNTSSGLNATAVTQTSATLSWNPVVGASDYTLAYKRTSDVNWISVTVAGTNHNLTGLIAGTSYDYRVQTNCPTGVSAFTSVSTFSTLLPPCNVPGSLSTSSITQTGAVLNWGTVVGAVNYTVQWRNVGNMTWSTTTLAGTSYTLTGLTANTAYEWQVRTNCSGNNSAFSSLTNFTTLAPTCDVPTGTVTSSITHNSAVISWNAMPGAVNYRVIYRLSSDVNWTGVDVSGTTFTLTGLLPASEYRWGVRTNCVSNSSAYSSALIFNTLAVPCNVPGSLSTSSVTQTGSVLNWGTVAGAVNYTVQWRNVGNLTWSTTTLAGTSHTLTGLTANTAYEWQVRTNCSGNNSVFSSLVNFTTLLPPCNTPGSLSTSSITQTGAVLNWGTVAGAVNYTVQWRNVGNMTWSSTTLAGTSHTLTGLTANTAYEWQVRTNCSGNNSAFSSSVNFTTLLPPCNVPGSLLATGITVTAATLNWGTVAGAVNYTVQWRNVGNMTWSTTTLAGTSHTLTGLTSNTAYEWQVRTNCSGNNSVFSSLVNFTTLQVCNVPGSLSTTGISTTVATANWAAVPGAVNYTLDYKPTLSGTWTSVTVSGTNYNFTGLTAATGYDWRIRTNCSGNNSAFSSVLSFTTTGSCTDLNESNNSSTTATALTVGTSRTGRICGAGDVDWFKVTIPATTNVRFTLSNLPLNYNVELFINGTFVVGSYQTGVTNDVIVRNGQTANTLYYRVYGQGNVFDNLLDYRVLAETSNVAFKDENGYDFSENELFTLYPNPARESVQLTFNSTNETSPVSVVMTDLNGKILEDLTLTEPAYGFNLPVEGYPVGVYIVRVTSGSRTETRKLIINR